MLSNKRRNKPTSHTGKVMCLMIDVSDTLFSAISAPGEKKVVNINVLLRKYCKE